MGKTKKGAKRAYSLSPPEQHLISQESLKKHKTQSASHSSLDFEEQGGPSLDMKRRKSRKNRTDLDDFPLLPDNSSSSSYLDVPCEKQKHNEEDCESPFITHNRFHVLSSQNDENDATTNNNDEMEVPVVTKEKRPPPIFVKNLTNFKLFYTKLNSLIDSSAYTCTSRLNDTKICPLTSDAYRNIIKYLEASEAQFHTYQPKQERAIRVVIRNLHYSTPPDDIKAELVEMGFSVRQVHNVKTRKTADQLERKPLPLFFVDLDPHPNVKDIYNLKTLQHTVIKVEDPHPKKDIVQCIQCQNYGHTKSYCHYPPRCVRCAGPHQSNVCTKPRDLPPICVLCQQNHPANYKGCTTYQTLRARLQPNRQTSQVQQHQFRHQLSRTSPAKQVTPTVSFSNIVLGSKNINQQPDLDNTQTSQETQPSTSADVHPTLRPTFSNVPPPSNNVDITSLLNSFMSDLRSLIFPVINLLNTVLSHLLPSQTK